jgi:hypothetical protein
MPRGLQQAHKRNLSRGAVAFLSVFSHIGPRPAPPPDFHRRGRLCDTRDVRVRSLCLALSLLGCSAHVAIKPAAAPPAPRPVPAAPGAPQLVELVSEDQLRVPIGPDHAFSLATVEAGRELIARRDGFVTGMSRLDRQLRTGKQTDVSEAELLAHFVAQVRPFRPEHIARIREAAAAIGASLAREHLSLGLKGDVPIVLTTGLEEAGDRVGVGYTREGVIYLNERALEEVPTYLLSHELFHVYGHHHPEARERLYEIIGFKRLPDRITWPQSVEARRVSNPDSPHAEHAIRVRFEGKDVLAAYVCLVDPGPSDASLFDQVSTYYALLEPEGGAHTRPGEDVVLANYQFFEGFFEQVGHNTGYLAGPEEILADNFELLLARPERARTPELLARLREVMGAP